MGITNKIVLFATYNTTTGVTKMGDTAAMMFLALLPIGSFMLYLFKPELENI